MAIALVALSGTIVLAGTGALEGDRGGPMPSGSLSAGASTMPTGSPPALDAPTIDGPSVALTREATWRLDVMLPAAFVPRRDAMVVVYRGEEVVAEREARRGESITISDIPLQRGDNELSVAIEGAQSSPRSASVLITRDDIAPRLRVTEPQSGAVVNAPRATIRGRADPGAALTIRNETSGQGTEATVAAGGAFELSVPLDEGQNLIVVRARDRAGNLTTGSLTVTRGQGEARVHLTMSDVVFRLRGLPDTVILRATALDANGAPVDGAPVVFTLSPPGVATRSFRTTTTDGSATWPGVTLTAQGTIAGQGFATVSVTLEDGSVVGDSVSFEFR